MNPYQSTNHTPEDVSRDELIEEFTVYFESLRKKALDNGHSMRLINRYEREMHTLSWELLSKVTDLAEQSTVPVYSAEQLEYIEQHYPKLVKGDVVEFVEPVPDPRLPEPAYYRRGVIEKVTRVFPNGCAEYGLFGLVESVDAQSEDVRPGCIELNARGAKVVDHWDLLRYC